jgi:hypothetical protein
MPRSLGSDPPEKMVKRFIATVPASLVLFGCAAQQTVWVKPGLTQDEFAKDRYACMQQSQQRVSAAFVSQYGGSASNHVITNANLFNACMNAQGYTLQKQASLAEQTAVKDQAKAALDAVNSEVLAFCASEEVRPYFSKTACKPEDITLDHVRDGAKSFTSRESRMSVVVVVA